MPRGDGRHGAGFTTTRANASAALAAAVLRRDVPAAAIATGIIDSEFRAGNSPCSGKTMQVRLSSLLGGAFPGLKDAQPLPSGNAGDVVIRMHDGRSHRLEIKAQLDKDSISQLTQADWVRNQTDALRWLRMNDTEFVRELSASNRGELDADPSDLRGWSFGELWLADLAGLTDTGSRLAHSIRSPRDLAGFLERKHLLHMCKGGDRLFSLASLPIVAEALRSPSAVDHRLKKNSASECAVQIRVGGSEVVFTYHIYPPFYVAGQPFVGRHKLHARALD